MNIEYIFEKGITLAYKKHITNIMTYLLETYPLKNHNRIRLTADQRRRKHIDACACYLGNGFSDMSVILQKYPDYHHVVVTVCHEYMHLVQSDEGRYDSNRCDLTSRAGGSPNETEADLFSIEAASKYLNMDPKILVNKLGLNNFYRLSREVIKSKYGVGAAK